MNKEMLDWAERYGHENMDAHMRVTEALARESHTTMTLLMTAIGAATAYAIRSLEAGTLTSVGVGVFSVLAWLILTAGLLLCKCQMTKDLHIGANEPKNLYAPAYEFNDLRVAELESLQGRIEKNVARNGKTARWLNNTRAMMLTTPGVFTLTWLAAAACR